METQKHKKKAIEEYTATRAQGKEAHTTQPGTQWQMSLTKKICSTDNLHWLVPTGFAAVAEGREEGGGVGEATVARSRPYTIAM